MKIMMVEPLDDGGIAHYTDNLLRALAEKGQSAVLFTSAKYEFDRDGSDYRAYRFMFRMARIVTEAFPWLNHETAMPSLIRRLLKLVEYPLNILEALLIARRERVDVIHFQTVNLIEMAMVLAYKLSGWKVVFTIHNVMPRHKQLKRYHVILYRYTYGLCDRLIIHSQNGKDDACRLFSIDPDKVSVIPHGDYKFFVPPDCPSPEVAKSALGITDHCATILFFGAIRPNKGLDFLLRAMPLIKKRVPDLKLLIVGEPCENFKKYRAIIDQEDIFTDIYMRLDYVPNHEVSRYFLASDLVVLPYTEITQSGVLQIAYAFGKAVVTTDIGGFSESVESGKNGYLVPPGRIDLLAESIADVIADREMIDMMGRHSRFLSDTKYSWDAIAGRTINVYAQLGGQRAMR